MEETVEPFSPEQVLATLKGAKPILLNQAREANPDWIPRLPMPRTFEFNRANLSQVNFRGMDLTGIDFSWANLQQAALDHADCSHSNFTGANLQGITVVGAQLHPVAGLFGHNRALYSPFSKSFSSGAEQATFSERGDHVLWSLLRSISTFRVFGTSYITIAVLVAYASWVEWVNSTAYSWATLFPADGGLRQQLRDLLLNQVPIIQVAPHFGIQILMVICLAVGATVYHLFCPDFIKENSESRWTRELNQSVIEYRSANASYPLARTIAVFFYGIGGLYTISYMFVRVVGATIYFLKGG